jgi:hypothetical protein
MKESIAINGELKKKTTAYPGNDAMRKVIEGLLL